MTTALLPTCEKQRLQALKELDILYLPLEDRFNPITRTLCRLFDVPVAYLSLIDDENQWFKSIHGLDLINTPRSDALCQHTLLEDEYLICEDMTQDPRFADNPYVTGAPYARFYAGYLLKSRDQNVGTLCIIDTKPRTFSQDDLNALADIASWAQTELNLTQISDAHVQLISELDEAYQQARIDSLTRLWNQGTIKQILHRTFQRHLLNLTPLSVLMIDADHFKKVNDTYGHAAGDKVLQSISSALRQALRPQDAIGRYGGEEFLIILDDCEPRQAAELAKRILNRVRNLSFPDVAPELKVTLSIGIAGSSARGLESETDLMDLADQALYRAKNNGRDQICLLLGDEAAD